MVKWKKSELKTILGIPADQLSHSETEYRIKSDAGEIWEYSNTLYSAYVRGRRYVQALRQVAPHLVQHIPDLKTIPFDPFEEFQFRFAQSDSLTVLKIMGFSS